MTISKKHEYYISKESVVRNECCFNCNNPLDYRSKSVHVNIHNNPSVKFFCNKECKHQWIYEMTKQTI